MSSDRRKQIKRHLSEKEIDDKLTEADDEKIVRRLSFLKNLYQGETIKEAADRVGRSESTGDRWADRWNENGLEGLAPSFGGGRPPKLDEAEQQQLKQMLREDEPWKSQEIQQVIKDEFDVEYHPDYLSTFLRNLGLTYSIPRPKRPSRPEDAEERLDERLEEALDEDDEPHNKREGDDEEGWTVDEEICTDGGTVLGFFDASHPQPYDNSRRMWYVEERHLERPLVKIFEPAVGFYSLTGTSLISFVEDQTKERICDVLEEIREQNPRTRILLVLDNHFSHTCEYTRKRAHQLGIDLVFLPIGAPDLNPLEQLWKQLKWIASPLVVESADEFRALITDIFYELANRVSFAKKWIEKFVNLQKLS